MGKPHKRFSTRWIHPLKSVAIIGSNGQLGTDLVRAFEESNWNVIPLSHEAIQIENEVSVSKCLGGMKLDYVINTAAFHKVNDCELSPEKAWLVNSGGNLNVCLAAKKIGAKVIYVSTDYVFDGSLTHPNEYIENDNVSPINVYGSSKVAGEICTITSNPNNLVVRVSSLFGTNGSGQKGGNFVETIIKKTMSGEDLKIFDNIIMKPTYSYDAAKIIEILATSQANGIFHITNSNSTSWFEFALEISRQCGIKSKISPSKWEDNSQVRKPLNSALSNQKLSDFGITPRGWQSALSEYLQVR